MPLPQPDHHAGSPGGGPAGRVLPAHPDLAAIGRQVGNRWAAAAVPQRLRRRVSGGPAWTCEEIPQVAHGVPGIHHARVKVVRDIIARYRAMRGFDVRAGGGWSCHGLPVEVAVERELGLASPGEIESYGIGRFNDRCRESAIRHIGMFTALNERIGCWAAGGPTRRTMDTAHIEAAWWSLRQLFDAGLLVRQERVGPYCPRCQTPLARGTGRPGGQARPGRRVTGLAVIARLRLAALPAGAGAHLRGADLLAAATAPWRLACGTGLAVHPTAGYVVARRAGHGDRVVVAQAVLGRVLGEGWHVAGQLSGSDLAGATYHPAFGGAGQAWPAGAHRVVPSAVVSERTGTGLAPVAPAFGARDLAVARAHGLPAENPIGPDGRFGRFPPEAAGLFFADADEALASGLADRGVLFRSLRRRRYEPCCGRCGTPLLQCARTAWHLRTSALPSPFTGGRTGPDWALSRTRYWGTPLPVWECDRGHLTCVASLAELSRLAGTDLSGLDPHRPQVDQVRIRCPECGQAAGRVSDVVDDWYDSGVLALTSPTAGAAGPGDENGPLRHLMAASADQARAWLRAVATVGVVMPGAVPAGGAPPGFVRHLGVITDERGVPMSKRHGNVAEPHAMIDRHGADAVRWFLAAAGPAGKPLRVCDAAVSCVARRVLLRYWNAVAFLLAGSASAGGHPESADHPAVAGSPAVAADAAGAGAALDRWLHGELQIAIGEVTSALDMCDPAAAGQRLARFIADLSAWYIRCSRRLPGAAAGGRPALRACLETLTRLIAPLAPFLADHVWCLLAPAGAADSVHLAPWPDPRPELVDAGLAGQMLLVRRLAGLGRSGRATARLPLRQPLATALVTVDADLSPALRHLLASELNVKRLELITVPSGRGLPPAHRVRAAVMLDTRLTPRLRREGLARRVIRVVQRARADDGLAPGQPIALRWHCADRAVATALAEHGAMIAEAVRAAEIGPASGLRAAAGSAEHVHAALGLAFWLVPVARAAP